MSTGARDDGSSGARIFAVVLNWNGWRDTLECLKSLQALDYPDLEIVLVDNGSTDDSVGRLRAQHATLPILETGRNLGFAGGSNVGIRYALQEGADYVWLLNNDTVVAPDALSHMVGTAEADSTVGLVGSVLRYAHEPARVQAWGGGRVRWLLGIPQHLTDAAAAARSDYIVGASLLIRREVLERIGLLDEGFFLYWEDADFGLRARRAGWRLAVAGDAVVYHKEGGTASGGERLPSLLAETEHLRSLVRFARKHRRLWMLPVATRALLEIANQILRGTASRTPALLATIARASLTRPGP